MTYRTAWMPRLPLIAFLVVTTSGTSSSIADDSSSFDKRIISEFVEAVIAEDAREVAQFIRFPLGRPYPIPAIEDEDDFVVRFSQVFDDEFIATISKSSLDSDWTIMGWRGIMFKRGEIWFDFDGKIMSINHSSPIEVNIRDLLIRTNKKTIHESIAHFESPILDAKSAKFRIRIDLMGNHRYRYASWPAGSSTLSIPDLVLGDGVRISDGSGGNHHYDFENGVYLYRVSVSVLGTHDSSPGWLEVVMEDETIHSEALERLFR